LTAFSGRFKLIAEQKSYNMNRIRLLPALIIIVIFTVTGNDAMAQRRGRQADTSATARERGMQQREARTREAVNKADTLGKLTEEEVTEISGDVRGDARGRAAEGRERATREREQREDSAGKDIREQNVRRERESSGNQGNAYGRNKGDLQGREFGQERARQARMNRETVEEELDEVITANEQKAAEARERIRVKREEIERERRENRLSEEEFTENQKKLEEAEKVLTELEEKVQKGKQLKEKKKN
jgi:hypothetical protein